MLEDRDAAGLADRSEKFGNFQNQPPRIDSRPVNPIFQPGNKPEPNLQLIDSIHSPPRFEPAKTPQTGPNSLELGGYAAAVCSATTPKV